MRCETVFCCHAGKCGLPTYREFTPSIHGVNKILRSPPKEIQPQFQKLAYRGTLANRAAHQKPTPRRLPHKEVPSTGINHPPNASLESFLCSSVCFYRLGSVLILHEQFISRGQSFEVMYSPFTATSKVIHGLGHKRGYSQAWFCLLCASGASGVAKREPPPIYPITGKGGE